MYNESSDSTIARTRLFIGARMFIFLDSNCRQVQVPPQLPPSPLSPSPPSLFPPPSRRGEETILARISTILVRILTILVLDFDNTAPDFHNTAPNFDNTAPGFNNAAPDFDNTSSLTRKRRPSLHTLRATSCRCHTQAMKHM